MLTPHYKHALSFLSASDYISLLVVMLILRLLGGPALDIERGPLQISH